MHLEGAQKVPRGVGGSESHFRMRFWLVVGVQEVEKGCVNKVHLKELGSDLKLLSLPAHLNLPS
jgi:hypothetical protein